MSDHDQSGLNVCCLHCYTAQEMKEMEARLDYEFGKESDREGS